MQEGNWLRVRKKSSVLPAECFGRWHNGRSLGNKEKSRQKWQSIIINILSFKTMALC